MDGHHLSQPVMNTSQLPDLGYAHWNRGPSGCAAAHQYWCDEWCPDWDIQNRRSPRFRSRIVSTSKRHSFWAVTGFNATLIWPQELLGVLSAFVNLTQLDLPRSAELDLGFDGGPFCGNAYFGRKGRQYRRQILQKDAEATERGGVIVAEILPRLENFTIGGYRATITKQEGVISNMTWPWSGRMKQWLMETVPEPLIPWSFNLW
jgi:hypothetical protein